MAVCSQDEFLNMLSNVLQDSPNKHGVMGSKSVGEPPLLLSASVLSAFQMAAAAAMEDLAHQHKSAHPVDSGAAEALQVCAASSRGCMPLQCLYRLSSTCAGSLHVKYRLACLPARSCPHCTVWSREGVHCYPASLHWTDECGCSFVGKQGRCQAR